MIRDLKGGAIREDLELLKVFRLVPKKIRDRGEDAIIQFLHGAVSRYMTYFYAILAIAVFANISMVIELFTEVSFIYGSDPISERLVTLAAFVIWMFLPFLWRERAMRFKDLLLLIQKDNREES